MLWQWALLPLKEHNKMTAEEQKSISLSLFFSAGRCLCIMCTDVEGTWPPWGLRLHSEWKTQVLQKNQALRILKSPDIHALCTYD